jgi:holo-[acyl-carrier protein] synthase
MIYGIGTDIVAVRRVEGIHARYGGKLAQRVLSPDEWGEYVQVANKERFLAKRFAVKEAFAKALGMGMRGPVSFTAMSVTHDPLGRPGLDWGPELGSWLLQRDIGPVHVSLSDEHDYVVAFVIAETRQ